MVLPRSQSSGSWGRAFKKLGISHLTVTQWLIGEPIPHVTVTPLLIGREPIPHVTLTLAVTDSGWEPILHVTHTVTYWWRAVWQRKLDYYCPRRHAIYSSWSRCSTVTWIFLINNWLCFLLTKPEYHRMNCLQLRLTKLLLIAPDCWECSKYFTGTI